MTVEEYKQIYLSVPDQPGVYRFLDTDGQTPLYIGKAKNLRKRVSSYFTKSNHLIRIKLMVHSAHKIEWTVVDTEQDALLLENSLIKRFKPKYNVALKDDKTYPYVCIKNEPFPRVFLTRQREKDGSEYFGPYTSVGRVQIILEFIKQLFPLRNCNLNLMPENIAAKKFRVCLEYHIGNCKGPCAAFQTPEDYDDEIRQIRSILKGQLQPVIHHLRQRMQDAVANYKFEEAEGFRVKLERLENYQSRSTIVNPSLDNIDVFAYQENDKDVYVNFMKIANGTIIQTKTYEIEKKLEEEKEELLAFVIGEVRDEMDSNAEEIIVPFDVDYELPNVKFTVPQRGDKLKLLELADKNLTYYLQSKAILKEQHAKTPGWERVLKQLQDDMKLKDLPVHIECFDNSNFQGSYPVAAMVCFKNAKPSKKDYRHFNIETVVGPDDFASMKEIVYRRYKRLLDEQQSLPNLIIIDGGKGQLSAAVESLRELDIEGKIAICGIAKRLEEIYVPGDPLPLYINKKSESLRLIQRIRDETHRFAITFHRSKRNKGTLTSELNGIKGIGQNTFEKLMQHYKSVKKIKEAPENELVELVGTARAHRLLNYFREQNQKENTPTQEPGSSSVG